MDYRQQIEQWLDKLRRGALVAADLQAALEAAPQQRLLYLQTASTGVDSQVLGMALVHEGQILEGPEDPEDWPYQSVLEALADGWRVVKFPELALLLEEDKTIGLGCEFILEKID